MMSNYRDVEMEKESFLYTKDGAKPPQSPENEQEEQQLNQEEPQLNQEKQQLNQEEQQRIQEEQQVNLEKAAAREKEDMQEETVEQKNIKHTSSTLAPLSDVILSFLFPSRVTLLLIFVTNIIPSIIFYTLHHDIHTTSP